MRENRLFVNRITIIVLLAFFACCQTQKPGILRAVGLAFASAEESGARDSVYYVAVNGDDS